MAATTTAASIQMKPLEPFSHMWGRGEGDQPVPIPPCLSERRHTRQGTEGECHGPFSR